MCISQQNKSWKILNLWMEGRIVFKRLHVASWWNWIRISNASGGPSFTDKIPNKGIPLFKNKPAYTVTELWQKANLGVVQKDIALYLPGSGVKLNMVGMVSSLETVSYIYIYIYVLCLTDRAPDAHAVKAANQAECTIIYVQFINCLGWFLQFGGGHSGMVKCSDHLSVHSERVASSAAEDTTHVNRGGFQHWLWHIIRSQQRSAV